MSVGAPEQRGPLAGITVVEMAGLGPAPFAATMLADAGATVLRVEGPRAASTSGGVPASQDVMLRGRTGLTIDLKKPGGTEAVLRLVDGAEALLEGYRPGVMERLGLGPEVCLTRKPALVYGRMTGWGQYGPLAQTAGHDINYIAISGALHAIGTEATPVPPLNLIGDFGGGATMLAFGMTSALLQAARTGRGQVVDAAMSDGAAFLMAPFYPRLANGLWQDKREANILDGGAPQYGVYRCSDGKFVAIGPLEPQFWTLFLKLVGLAQDPEFVRRDPALWAPLRDRLARHFITRTRDEWCAMVEGTDACLTPVLTMEEAVQHPHNVARCAFVEVDGAMVPAPVPRFGSSDNAPPPAMVDDAAAVDVVLARAGFSGEEIADLREREVLG